MPPSPNHQRLFNRSCRAGGVMNGRGVPDCVCFSSIRSTHGTVKGSRTMVWKKHPMLQNAAKSAPADRKFRATIYTLSVSVYQRLKSLQSCDDDA